MAEAGFLALPPQTLREASLGGLPSYLLLLIAGAFLVLTVVVPALLLYWRKKRKLKSSFFQRGKELGLKEEELSLLWRYLSKFPVNPLSLFESKALFERVASAVAKGGSEEEVKLLPVLRKKLRFENLPWFIPLRSPKELDLYQTGLLTGEKERGEAFLAEKDEESLLLVPFKPMNLNEGEKVKFFFVREDDARYYAEGTMEKKTLHEGKEAFLLKTEDFKRVQLREAPRWKVKLKALFVGADGKEREGTVADISVKGLRLCTSPETPLKEGEVVAVSFRLGEKTFKRITGRVIYVKELDGKKCAGVEFIDASPEEKKAIEAFIKEEQRKLEELYRSGEKDEQ